MPVTWTFNQGILTIDGTENTDRIAVREVAYDPITQSATVSGSIYGIANPFNLFNGKLSGVQKIIVNGYGGDDSLLMLVKNISTDLYGNDGDDTLRGGQKIDIIQGGAGDDTFETAGGWSHNDLIDGGDGTDTFSNGVDNNSRVSRASLTADNSIEILTLNKCALDGDDNDNIFDFSNTTLDNVGGRHAWYQRSRGGNDTVYTSPNLINISYYQHKSTNPFWYDGDGHPLSSDVPQGTQDRINIVLTTEQLSRLSPSQITQLETYVVNPSPYRGSQTFHFISEEAGVDFRASNFEQASIVLKSGDELIDITDSLFDTETVILGTDGTDKLVASSNNQGFLLGLGGNDTLVGGAQDDVLSGGSGNDIFKFKPGFGQDTITDFKVDGNDRIDLRAFHLSGLGDLTIAAGVDRVLTSAAFGDGSIILKNSDSNVTLLASDFLF